MEGRVIAVLSPKGGTGKTTVSTNLAVGLARHQPGEVVLVDLDLAFGDIAAALLLDARKGVLDDLDDPATVRRHPSGLHVVAAPDERQPTDTDVGDRVGPALELLASRYSTVVLDTGAGFDAVTQAAVSRASDLVLVGSMDVPTLLGLRKVLGWLDGLGLTAARRHLVLNRADASVGLELEDVEATVRLPVAVAIPSDQAVTRSVNEGRPLTQLDGDDPASFAFRALVARFRPRRPGRRRRSWRRRTGAV